MIFDLRFILYACVSKGTTVLADFNSGADGDLEMIALQCLENYPLFHATFSHTTRRRIYSFLIIDPFVCFAILDERYGKKSESFLFLECVKDAFLKMMRTKSIDAIDNLKSYCIQEEFKPVFSDLIMDRVWESRESRFTLERMFKEDDNQNGVIHIMPAKNENKKKKKKRKFSELVQINDRIIRDSVTVEKNTDESDDDDDVISKEFSIGRDDMEAKKMWRRHVWTVLFVDLIVCCVLLGVWLWICRGFECLAS